MAHERLAPPNLLAQAFEIQTKREAENLSIKEAKTRIPELESKIKSLLGIEEETPMIQTPDTDREMAERMAVKIKDPKPGTIRFTREDWDAMEEGSVREFSPVVDYFQVPVNRQKFKVQLSKGIRSDRSVGYVDRGFMVNVSMLDSFLRIDGDCATIKYRVHNREPFQSREMNMDDFNDYNALLDRLSDPDVKRAERQTVSDKFFPRT